MYGKGWGKIFLVKNKRKKGCKIFSIIQQREYHCPLLVILSFIKIWITCLTATVLNITLAVAESKYHERTVFHKVNHAAEYITFIFNSPCHMDPFQFFPPCLLRFLCAMLCSKHSPAISAQLDKSKRTLCTWKEIVHLTVRLFFKRKPFQT